MNAINIETTPTEYRQIARRDVFAKDVAMFIDWNTIARTARELGAAFTVQYGHDGACAITMFWSYTEAELDGMNWEGRK